LLVHFSFADSFMLRHFVDLLMLLMLNAAADTPSPAISMIAASAITLLLCRLRRVAATRFDYAPLRL